MAGEVAGKTGSITYDGLTKGVKAWTLNLVGDVLEITDYEDAGVRAYIAGPKGWTGTAEFNWDTTNTVTVGDSATLTLTIISTTETYSGTAIVTGISVSSSFDGLVTASITFQGSGVCTLTSTS